MSWSHKKKASSANPYTQHFGVSWYLTNMVHSSSNHIELVIWSELLAMCGGQQVPSINQLWHTCAIYHCHSLQNSGPKSSS